MSFISAILSIIIKNIKNNIIHKNIYYVSSVHFAFFILFLLVLAIGQPVKAQSLEGQVLAPANDAETTIGSWLQRRIAGEERPDGQINSVRVVEDDTDRLTVEVAYSGFVGMEFTGEITNADIDGLRGIVGGQAVAGPSPVRLSFSVNSTDDSAEITSAYIVINIRRAGTRANLVRKVFGLPKTWRSTILVRPEPLGSAGRLKQRFGLTDEIPKPERYASKNAQRNGKTDSQYSNKLLIPANYTAADVSSLSWASMNSSLNTATQQTAPPSQQVLIQQQRNVTLQQLPSRVILQSATLPEGAGRIQYALRANNGKYLAADGGGGNLVRAASTKIQSWERFTIIDRNGGALKSGDPVHLLSSNGKHYITLNSGNTLARASSTIPAASTIFTLISGATGRAVTTNSRVVFRAASGKYIGVNNRGVLDSNFSTSTASTRFQLSSTTAAVRPSAAVIAQQNQSRQNQTAVLQPGTVTIAKQFQTRSIVQTRTSEAIKALPASRLGMIKVRPDLRIPTDEDAKPEPEPTVDLSSSIAIDAPLADDIWDQLPFHTRLYADTEGDSRKYYFLPRKYNVSWATDDARPGFYILYQAAGTDSEGLVQMAANLQDGVSTQDRDLLKKILDRYLSRNSQQASRQLSRYPTDKLPEISLTGNISRQYAVDPESIWIEALSQDFDELQVSWITDSISSDNMILALREGLGINGNMLYLPAEGVDQTIAPSIPVQIDVQTEEMFGNLEWTPDTAWQNQLPYPVKLKYLHAVVMENRGSAVATVYSWSMNDTEVPIGKRVRFDEANVPATLNSRAAKVWVQYEIDKDCDNCVSSMLDRSGVVRASRNAIRIIPTPRIFEMAGALEVWVYTRSKYFHPQNRTLEHAEVVEIRDFEADYAVEPVFLVDRNDGEEREGDPLYEYRIEILTEDGDILSGDTWLPANGLRLPIGRRAIEGSLGYFPNSEEEEGTSDE